MAYFIPCIHLNMRVEILEGNRAHFTSTVLKWRQPSKQDIKLGAILSY